MAHKGKEKYTIQNFGGQCEGDAMGASDVIIAMLTGTQHEVTIRA